MRNWIIAIIYTLILIGLLFSVIYIAFGESNPTLDQTKIQLQQDPTKIAEWIKQNIKPVQEDIQYAQLPERTYKYRTGDCEDIALLAQYLIGDKYPTYIIVWNGNFNSTSKYYEKYKTQKISHVVLAIDFTPKYTHQGSWGVIDQDRFIGYETSLEDIIRKDGELRRVDIKDAYFIELYKWHLKLGKRII